MEKLGRVPADVKTLDFSKPVEKDVRLPALPVPGQAPSRELPSPTPDRKAEYRLPTYAVPSHSPTHSREGQGTHAHHKHVPQLPDHARPGHSHTPALPTHTGHQHRAIGLPETAAPRATHRVGIPETAPAPTARVGSGVQHDRAHHKPAPHHHVPKSFGVEPFEPTRITTYYDV